MNIIAHTMEYHGTPVSSPIQLRNYQDSDYEIYKKTYEECFYEMRTALHLTPVNCCGKRENLLKKRKSLFLYEKQGQFIGSVAIYKNEIDDLFISKKQQRQGYGQSLLQFAISYLQQKNIAPIQLSVADWNQGAINMYLQNGFVITKTEHLIE